MGTKIKLKQESFELVRKLMGWTSDVELARALKVDRTTIYRNLKAKDTVSLDFIDKLMRALDKRLDAVDLFEEVDEPEQAQS